MANEPAASDGAGVEVYWCPFPATLHPDRIPDAFEILKGEPAEPPTVRRLRGERRGVAIALRNGSHHQRVRASVASAGPRGMAATVGVATFVERRSPYVRVVAARQGAGQRVRSWPLADAIVPDEAAWTSTNWTAHTRYATLCATDAATSELAPGAVRYLWVDLLVGEDVPSGRHEVVLHLRGAGGERRIDLAVEVLPHVLPAHDRVVVISNDLVDDPVLKWLAELGCTGLRARDVTRRTDAGTRLAAWRKSGFRLVIQHQPPRSRAEVDALPTQPSVYFYGRDEPQPKPSQGRTGWDAMAEHVRRSREIHAKGGRVVTSIPFDLAEALADRGSELYGHLAPLGLGDAFEPLDFANYGAGVQRLDRLRGGSSGFHAYVARLREDRRQARLDARGRPVSKRDRLETFYAPHGMMRDPFFARLLFGFYLAGSELDGAFAWTAWRPRGSPVTDEDGADATLLYPGAGGVISTWTAEALRAGVADLRLVVALGDSSAAPKVADVIAPFGDLLVDGQRIDAAHRDDAMHRARESLLELLAGGR